MGKRDRRVDAYIKKSPEFARPILEHIREVVHDGCPDVEETLKWSMPSFTYNGILCGMAAFKQHAVFGFWKGALILTKDGRQADEAMGNFGKLTKVSDLPTKKVLIGYIHKAMKLNDEGVPNPAFTKRKPKPALSVPADLKAALAKNKKAGKAFEAFAPSHRREYIEWITEAKREATRATRLKTAIEWIAEGKARNWKYENC
jgi:uncharacterized protein YdeI (YjbR/CyaY-like superfamily)